MLPVCPEVQLLESSDRLHDFLRERLEEFFSDFRDSDYVCEVRRDPMYGGPILSLQDGNGMSEIFLVAVAERWTAP